MGWKLPEQLCRHVSLDKVDSQVLSEISILCLVAKHAGEGGIGCYSPSLCWSTSASSCPELSAVYRNPPIRSGQAIWGAPLDAPGIGYLLF